MTTKEEQRRDQDHALKILENERQHLAAGGLLIFVADYGSGQTDYYRAVTARHYYGRETLSHLTWAIGTAFGYGLRDKNGRWYLAVSGGNFSKTDQLARDLAAYYGLKEINHDTI